LNNGLERNAGRLRRHSLRQSTLWIETALRKISDVISKEEEKRQDIIHGIIYTEQSFVDNLETFESLYMEAFRYTNIISDPVEFDDFIKTIFRNISAIRQTSTVLLQTLIKRQEEKGNSRAN
jgi:hypothetical protein